ncbi:TIGR00266 family protein [Clostridium tertium]|uniref:TIGR00266 family protein n=1 Tax=Clostridium tertium TaxID=1559 RepID=A0A6N3EJ62_9CLOT
MEKKFELLCSDSNKVLKINATRGEEYTVESGAMVSMTPVFDVKAKTGGLGKTLGRMFSGEGLFIQKFKAKDDGELLLAPQFLGDIQLIEMDGSISYRLGRSTFLASTQGIEVSTKSGGIGGMFSGEGLIQMQASGVGTLIISSYGAIMKKELQPGENYIVDSNHMVLWDSSMKYSVEFMSGVLSSIAGGEGLVCKFQGPGELWIQSRNPATLVQTPK